MDLWNIYKKKTRKEDLSKINVAEAIAYGNLLINKIAWKIIHGKKATRLFKQFFDTADLILKTILNQKEYSDTQAQEIYKHIDMILDQVKNLVYTKEEIALMIGNLSEYTDSHYTFTELIGFIRFLAS